jgi:hypothetical protein
VTGIDIVAGSNQQKGLAMQRVQKAVALRWIVLGCLLTGLVACAPSDYTDGITAFSTAVDKANSAEQTLTTAYQQSFLDTTISQAGKGNLSYVAPDFNKCNGVPGPYHAGDCAVRFGGAAAPVKPETSSMGSLTKYAALLSSVTTDKSCSTLQTDSKDIGTAIGGIAKALGNPEAAAAASAVATILSTIGCEAIEAMQLKILRNATAGANPIIKQLVPVIANKDATLQAFVINANVTQLSGIALDYLKTNSTADLKQMVTLTQAIDQAQLAPSGPVIQKLADLHQALTDDLASPNVTLKRVESDSQALIASAGTVETAVKSLASPSKAH